MEPSPLRQTTAEGSRPAAHARGGEHNPFRHLATEPLNAWRASARFENKEARMKHKIKTMAVLRLLGA